MTGGRERLGVLGGSFNPVHVGHLFMAELAREAAGLDRILFVPAARPPHKRDRVLAPPQDRLAMLRLALESEPAAGISGIELEPGGPSYTVDTLDALQAQNPGARLHFVLGMDSLLELDSWRNPEAIFSRHAVVAVDRPGFDPADLDPALATRVRLVRGNPFAVSSTLVRRRVGAGLGVRHLVPPAVAAYLETHRLYGEESP